VTAQPSLLLVAAGIDDDRVARSPRCRVTLRGRRQPVEAFVLGA
jgi:hypothetical protein